MFVEVDRAPGARKLGWKSPKKEHGKRPIHPASNISPKESLARLDRLATAALSGATRPRAIRCWWCPASPTLDTGFGYLTPSGSHCPRKPTPKASHRIRWQHAFSSRLKPFPGFIR
jgi:hypothetical protein